MTRDDIIKMAHEAGLHLATNAKWMPIVSIEYAEKFAALVAAAEREACAQVCDARCVEDGWEGCYADACAAAIRARGQG